MNLNEISELVRTLAKLENPDSVTIYEHVDYLRSKEHVTDKEKEELAVWMYKNSSYPDDPSFYQLSEKEQNYYRDEVEATLAMGKN